MTARPRRILIFGGAMSVHLQRWALGLASRGLEIKVVSLGGKALDGIDTEIVPRRNKLSYLSAAGRAAAVVRQFHPDLVHAHYASSYGLWAWRAKFHPNIVSVWGSDVVAFPRGPLRYWLLRRILSQADQVTATSEYLSRVTRSLLPKVESKICVIPFGVELPSLPETIDSTPPLRICYLKHLELLYGPDTLLEATALAHRQGVAVRLSMAGGGSARDVLSRQATKLGIGDLVTFEGPIESRSVQEFLARHHVMVMPSLEEGFGVAALEAAAAGLPVIATSVGGIPEAVRDGQTGLLVPPSDPPALAAAIVRLARDTDLRCTMGRQGRQFVQKEFSRERSLDKMIDLYEHLIDKRDDA